MEKKQWDVKDVVIRVPGNSWGIPLSILERVQPIFKNATISLISTLPVYIRDGVLTVEGLQVLVTALKERGVLPNQRYSAGEFVEILARTFAESIGATKKNIPTFNGKRVLVVGTGSANFSGMQQLMAEAIGRALVVAGYGLICGGWPGVDEHTAKEFIKPLVELQLPTDRLMMVFLGKHDPAYQNVGVQVDMRDDEEWYDYSTSAAFAVIMIGGEGGTYASYIRARGAQLPVIPIAATGGDAAQVYKELKDNPKYLYSTNVLDPLAQPVSSPKEADEKALQIISILDGLPVGTLTAGHEPLSEKMFEELVKKVYKNRKVVVPDDIQKDRWGGKSTDKGVHLKASVVKLKKDRKFSVTLIVEGIPGFPKLEGRVAFFVHQTFEQEIYFEEALKGKAQLKFTGYGGFTVGAYLENGTMLELDLNETPGYPKEFYNKEAPGFFMQEVQALYKSREIKVTDDPQKGRWGGKSISNGKRLDVAVKMREDGRRDVHLEISSEDSRRPLTGFVAFFLGGSFHEKIRYTEARAPEGIAKLDIVTHEVFTVGAYTQDGTELELDLSPPSYTSSSFGSKG